MFGCTVITAWESSSSFVSVVWFLSLFLELCINFLSSQLFSSNLQVLGQLHGGCSWWFHERQSPQWHAHHYSSQEVHGTHSHHLSSCQKTQTGLPPTHGRRRGPGEPLGRGWTSWGSVPWVGDSLDFLC